jgi:hypothetical protein
MLQGRSLAVPRTGPLTPKPDDDSTTESLDDEQPILKEPTAPTIRRITDVPAAADKKKTRCPRPGSDLPKEVQMPAERSAGSDSPPSLAKPPPLKKAKQAALSSSDSDASDKGASGPSIRRGARQPVKRGGRRF